MASIDTVGLRVKVRHEPFGEVFSKREGRDKKLDCSRRDYPVPGRYFDCLRLMSLRGGQIIQIEGHCLRFLQGHNITGTTYVEELLQTIISRVLIHRRITPTKQEWREILNGHFKVCRIELFETFRVESESMLSESNGLDWKQWRQDEGVRVFVKRPEVPDYDLLVSGEDLRRKRDLTHELSKWSRNMLRFEVVLGSRELKRQGLDTGAAWTQQRVREVIDRYMDKLACRRRERQEGKGLDGLSGVQRMLWQVAKDGHNPEAFVSKRTIQRARKALYERGIAFPEAGGSADLGRILSKESRVKPFPRFARDTDLFFRPVRRV